MTMQDRIDQILQRAASEADFSGVCLVTRGDETVYHRAFGLAHRGFGITNTTATRFDIASVTKLFTATAIMQLVERELIRLETRVMPFLERADTVISDAVTVFHLLTHTSGIAEDADEEAGEDYELLFIDKPNYAILKTVDFLPQCSCKEAVFAPGEGVRYNNCAFVLLGLVIERSTGVSYRDYVTEHIFRRAGMPGADFCAMDGVCPDLAEHYKRVTHDDGTTAWRKNIYSYPPVGSPDGGATVSALDLDIFYRAIANRSLLGEDAAGHLLTPKVFVKNRGEYRMMNGFGFEFQIAADDRVVTIEKEGENAGVAANFAHYPGIDTTFVLLANQDCNVWAIVRGIEPLLLAE